MDFLADQSVFSDTDSRVNADNFKFATVDVGYSFSPTPGLRIGGFIGYHFWREKVVADGLQCNQQNIFGTCPPGGVVIPYGTPVIEYEATWHALRVGVEGTMRFADRWSVSAELAGIPWAKLQNKDSHLFRSDLGPVPNIFSDSTAGFGLQAELFVNYEVTPNIEIGAGVRYWGLMANRGNVHFGPGFDNSFPLNNFEQHRYGMLLQVKGRF
jgi:outer membrane protease